MNPIGPEAVIAEAFAKDAAAAGEYGAEFQLGRQRVAEETQAALQVPLGLRVLTRSARCTVASTLHRGSGAPASPYWAQNPRYGKPPLDGAPVRGLLAWPWHRPT